MKVAVIGSGAVGCYYGAQLARCGHDVHFLMRRDFDAVRKNGLNIRSCLGDFDIRVAAYRDSAEIGPVELVVCALKATAMDAAEKLIRPCVGPHTKVLALMNGLGIEEQFARWFEPRAVFGGLAFVCINRGEPGIVHHLDYGRIVIGHLFDDYEQASRIAALWAEAGLDSTAARSLRQARWEKLMWNIPFNSLAVTAGVVTTDKILADDGLRELARELMLETAAAAKAEGCAIDTDTMVEKMLANTATMGAYRPSMLIDFETHAPLEVEAILGEPVRRAAAAGVAVPRMAAQYRLTRFLDRLNRAGEKNV